ncbi:MULTISPECIES: gluzincin family metallopeptidase [Tenacibaculum]|uniref:aminopeptidase n=1 Tax=Tenacibaculum TaxID=104267 RepID=UPI001F0B09FE|nr:MULTISPECIES: aminopeptidase [Tenacibaculum]MCH3882460.1 aminopeptidase [Tenacibaculum aquimarinum]MDO6600058.1 aminopeptidase [Tenacibaculum sp. 1_MG-2023]
MNFKKALFILLLFSCKILLSQTNAIKIDAHLLDNSDKLSIVQEITFHNKTNTILNNLYLHNWANSFANNNTPLAKRFLEDYKSTFYFSKNKEKGSTTIHNLLVNYQKVEYNEVINHQDILKIDLNTSLKPNDSIVITANYTVKIPDAKFTRYGKTKTGFHLRYWYLTPVVYENGWQTMSNLNLDDLYMNIANYNISITAPRVYSIESNLKNTLKKNRTTTTNFIGNNTKDVIISIDSINKFTTLKTKKTLVKTDLLEDFLDPRVATDIVDRELNFIEDFLGKYPNKEIFIDRNSVGKNSLHDIYGLPKWLKPFPENFRWEMRFFNSLTIKYLDDVLLFNKRKDYWLKDGIQTFLMIEYVKKYYPEVTILGKYSKYWGIKSYNISKLKQNDKYQFVYQFSARKFFDQALNVRADSLSNFNRKVVSKYKAGLGFRYLQDYIGDSILKNSFKEFYGKNQLKPTNSLQFKKILTSKTDKNLDWFFGDYISTDKKIDYKIKKVVQTEDSLKITIKNKREMTAPVALYGVKDKEIKFKKWITGVDSTKTITIPKNGFDKLALNYEQLYPEYNSLDNFRKTNNSLLNKPFQFRPYKDVGDPYYNQLFYSPNIRYNLYDGLILGINLNNKPVLAHNFEFSLTPNYSTKSKNLTGGYALGYNHFFKSDKIYKIKYGVSGSNFHYAPELGYNKFSPFVNIQFKRNSLRDVGTKFLLTRLVYINKDVPDSLQVSERDKYTIFNVRYVNSKPNVVKRFQYALNAEFGNNFTKFSTDIRYRKEFNRNQNFELRFFGGVFLNNKSKGDYFSFGLNRGSDYLFEQNLFGRSESSGLFSQQFVVADGGFKSNFNQDVFANQLATSINSSIGIWNWIEVYNDAAMLKNKNQNPRFFYENGVRLNFIPNIFEFYLPVYTNEGFQFNDNYSSKIRFVITTSFDRIYNYIRRGLL